MTGTLITEGRFKGQNIAYPYLIAERNNMELFSFFQGGRTIAFPADGAFHNSLTDPEADCYYRNIPEDVDYITIYLGIIPLGTIDDRTTATYYGAFNEVLSWLLVNRPFAHIGILVSNGCDRPAYRTAQIELATKFGIPYIDMNGDRFTPVMIRSMNPDIPEEVKQAVKIKQAADYPANTHPNDRAHEFESWFIEDFLRRI